MWVWVFMCKCIGVTIVVNHMCTDKICSCVSLACHDILCYARIGYAFYIQRIIVCGHVCVCIRVTRVLPLYVCAQCCMSVRYFLGVYRNIQLYWRNSYSTIHRFNSTQHTFVCAPHTTNFMPIPMQWKSKKKSFNFLLVSSFSWNGFFAISFTFLKLPHATTHNFLNLFWNKMKNEMSSDESRFTFQFALYKIKSSCLMIYLIAIEENYLKLSNNDLCQIQLKKKNNCQG